MKNRFCPLVLAILGILLASPWTRAAAAENAKPVTPGVEMAQAISTVTGVAISPLLGVGAVGAWKYVHTPRDQHANLPWFARPAFWIPALLLVTLVAAKDIFGTAAPTVLKKPFDIAEAIENKISGLVAAGAFVPLVASVFHSAGGDQASLSAAGFYTIDLSWLYNAISIPVAILAFIIVWLVGNAIHVLIIISPFTTVDTALKGARLALLATVPLTSAINPWFGAAWALVIIVVSWFLAGWSLRLTHFGAVFVWDWLTLRSRRYAVSADGNRMFLGRKLNKVPVRTYGTLLRNESGKLVFRYHPWLVLPPRTLELPDGSYEVGRGLIYSEILRVEGQEMRSMLTLPPRYRGKESELAMHYGLAGIREVGLRAAWKWLKELFNGKPALQPATV